MSPFLTHSEKGEIAFLLITEFKEVLIDTI
jgi:hypothetical protein